MFNDGTGRTFPAPAEEVNDNRAITTRPPAPTRKPSRAASAGSATPTASTCIAGDRRSNAKGVPGQSEPTHGSQAGIAKLLDADENNTSTVFSSNGTSRDDRNQQQLGLNSISRGVSDIRQWMTKLYGEAFAAVYVQPGRARRRASRSATGDRLRTSPGRKVDYSSGAAHATADLD
ncbi:hypothetical protein ACPA9J_30340 [Pseudomonas aeruginosa]